MPPLTRIRLGDYSVTAAHEERRTGAYHAWVRTRYGAWLRVCGLGLVPSSSLFMGGKGGEVDAAGMTCRDCAAALVARELTK